MKNDEAESEVNSHCIERFLYTPRRYVYIASLLVYNCLGGCNRFEHQKLSLDRFFHVWILSTMRRPADCLFVAMHLQIA